MRTFRIVVGVVCVLWPALTFAQSLAGVAKDASGAVLPGVVSKRRVRHSSRKSARS